MIIEFFVPGLPRPAGSKSAYYIEKIGRAVVTDANPKAKDWKAAVAVAARAALPPKFRLLTGRIEVTATFFLPRPRGHYGTGKNADKIKDSALIDPLTKPDLLKIMRGTEDACTGIVWRDDAQIADEHTLKHYDDNHCVGVEVRIEATPSTFAELKAQRARQLVAAAQEEAR